MKRWGDNGTIRAQRTVGVAHAEAFQLMRYDVRNEPSKPSLWFWNSRDGVTPFGTTIDGVEYTHAMHGYATRYIAVLPAEATMVWVDYTPEAWREMLHRRWQIMKDRPAGDWHDPVDFARQWPTAEAFEAVDPYRPGEPMSLTREQFLETTHSWHGRASEDQS